jgi:N-acetylglucosaminyldiphosphoundecaprenol N-acetyl-beta-D-mannosaminyltransferase
MNLPVTQVIGHPVTALSFNTQIDTMLGWAKARLSKVVCVANVHMLMEASWHLEFGTILQKADIVTPDGMPLVWMMRLLGINRQDRVAGLDILVSICRQAEADEVSVYFLGSQAFILDRIRARLIQEFPNLKIAGMEPLPFRPLTLDEDEALIERVNESKAGVVCVALGCPKQEYWMAAHKHRIQAVMIGLGGAFSVYAGIHRRAPQWVRQIGFEWLYRLLQEPHRLLNRYATTIPPFIYLALRQILAEQLFIPLQKQASLK